MKHRFLLRILQMAAIGFTLAAFSGQGLAAGGVSIVSTKDLERMLESPIKPTLIYTLSHIEFMEARIAGSICIPMEKMERSDNMPVDPNTALVFYCLGPG
jgi:hypothetical protein